MPGKFVFPGGQIAAEDRKPWRFEREASLGSSMPSDVRAGARAAIREAFEETSLLIGERRSGKEPPFVANSAIENAFALGGVIPNLGAVRLIARAITPRQSPIRFNTYFYLVVGDQIHGTIRGNGELDDIGWYETRRCGELDMADVTRFVLSHSIAPANRAASRIPLYCYRNRVPQIQFRAG